MEQITNIRDEFLIVVCNLASISAMELLEQCEYNSYEWLLHTSGISYGIWISICDQSEISLEEINEIINEMVLSNLN